MALHLGRSKSPFRGATKNDLAMLRRYATRVVAWKDSAAEGNYYTLEGAPIIWGGFNAFRFVRILIEFERRALNQLMQLENWSIIQEQRLIADLKGYDPRGYEIYALNRELLAAEALIAEMKATLGNERPTASGGA